MIKFNYNILKNPFKQKHIDVRSDKNKLKIVAFSDLHVQNIQKCIEIIKKVKPDIILYGGDEIKRFENIPLDTLKQLVESKLNNIDSDNVFFNPLLKVKEGYYSSVRELLLFCFKKEKKDYTKEEVINILVNYIIKNLYDFHVTNLLNNLKISDDQISFENVKKILEQQLIYYKYDNGYLKGFIYLAEENHYFKKMADISKYGLCFVLGNHDHPIYRLIGKKYKRVYNVHQNPLIVGNFVIIGLDGVPIDNKMLSYVFYDEEEAKIHLDNMTERYTNKKIIVLSHAPPYGILDNAIRFEENHIGSKALIEFIKEKDPLLVICGHVHREGGKEAIFKNTHIINVSSHDDNLSPGNIALIEIENNKIRTKWMKIPSNFELAVKNSKSKKELYNNLYNTGLFYKKECDLLISAIEEFGDDFVSKFPNLYWNIKYKYSFSLSHIIELYRIGVKRPEDIKKEHVEKLVNKIKNGLSKKIMLEAFSKLFADIYGKLVILSSDLNWLHEKKVAYFDAEYIDPSHVVLYGFLVDGKIKQFSVGEEDKVFDFVDELISKGYKIFHYGGSDRKIILDLFKKRNMKLKPIKESFVNVEHKIKTQIGVPLNSKKLKDIADFFDNSEKEIKKFEYSFSDGRTYSYEGSRPFDFDGLTKLYFCKKVLEAYQKNVDFKNMKEYILLKETNKMDLYDLQKIVNHLREAVKQNNDIIRLNLSL